MGFGICRFAVLPCRLFGNWHELAVKGRQLDTKCGRERCRRHRIQKTRSPSSAMGMIDKMVHIVVPEECFLPEACCRPLTNSCSSPNPVITPKLLASDGPASSLLFQLAVEVLGVVDSAVIHHPHPSSLASFSFSFFFSISLFLHVTVARCHLGTSVHYAYSARRRVAAC